MIMRRGQELLLPVKPGFMALTLLLALGLNLLGNMGFWGRAAWAPDVLALVLLFWTVHQPQRVGLGTAFALGLVVDVHAGALLGQHALGYVALVFLGMGIHRRVLWFSVPTQALHVLPLLLADQVLMLLVRALSGSDFPGWPALLAPLLQAALWPLATVLLLWPQRLPPDPDSVRPL